MAAIQWAPAHERERQREKGRRDGGRKDYMIWKFFALSNKSLCGPSLHSVYTAYKEESIL